MNHTKILVAGVLSCVLQSMLPREAVCQVGAGQTARPAVVRYHFDNYTTAHGLSSNQVLSITSDSLGHLWVGTDYGLNRFDGSTFKVMNGSTQPQMYRNDIQKLGLYRGGDVFAGGYNGMLLRYDYKTDCLQPAQPADFRTTYYKAVNCINTTYGTTCVGTSSGFYVYNTDTARFVALQPLYGETDQMNVEEVLTDSQGRYWLVAGGHVMVYDSNGKKLIDDPVRPGDVVSYTPRLLQTGPGTFVASRVNGRLDFYSVNAIGRVAFTHSVNVPFGNVRGVSMGVKGDLWFACDGDGLWHCATTAPHSGSDFQNIVPFDCQPQKFRKLYALHCDSQGKIWVGSHSTGLWCCQPREIASAIFTSAQIGIKNSVGTDFASTRRGELLMASDGIGLYCCKPDGREPALWGAGNGIESKNITSVLNASDGTCWVTTWGGGVYRAGAGSPVFTRETMPGLEAATQNFFKAFETDGGDIWICSGGDGIYARRSGKWEKLALKSPEYGPSSDNWPYFAIKTEPGHSWVFTSSTAWRVDGYETHPVAVHYQDRDGDIHTLVSINDACYHRATNSVVAATNHGLLRFSTDGKKADFIGYVPLEDYSSVVTDQHGRLWASGTMGIVRVDDEARSFYTFPVDFSSKGQNYFIHRSRHVNPAGRIFFGNNDGFFSFHPDSLPRNGGPRYLSLSGISIGGQNVALRPAGGNAPAAVVNGDNIGTVDLAHGTGSLTLRHNMTDVAVMVDAVDFNETKSPIAYRLRGLNDDFTAMESNQKIHFNYIPAGDYTLEIVPLAADGDAPGVSIDIKVLPPWWKTWWFVTLCVLLVAAYILYKIHALRRDKVVLQQMVDERTKDLKDKNQLIEKRNAELNKVLSYKDRLIAVVAHDLKNPMFAIVGALEGLVRRKDTPRGELEQVVGSVLESARTLQNEMSKLLAWATSSQDDIEYRPSNIVVSRIVADDIALLRASAGNKGVELKTEINVPRYTYADSRMVSTVVRNVINNAIKFTPEGKTVNVRAWQEGAKTFIAVADEGVGMSAEKIAELQSEGRHASTAGTQGETGTGLGVGIARDYVAQNNGRMSIESEPGAGTTVTIELPATSVAVAASDIDDRKVVPQFEIDTELMEGNTILVVDDDPLICQNIKNMLQPYANVLTAGNGQQALQMVEQGGVDIVVSDVEMPVMNGIDMSMKMAQNPQTNYIPVLFLSAKSTESDRLIGLLSGAIDYIPKPFSQSELLIKLNNILALRQKQQQRLMSQQMDGQNGSAEAAAGSDEGDAATAGGQINPVLQQMIDIIEKHYSDSQYSIEKLASDMCMTKITLYRRVKTLTGQTPIEILNQYRLNKALALLRGTDSQVGDVAFQVGFSDPAYFTRRFRSQFGYPPSAVKRQGE